MKKLIGTAMLAALLVTSAFAELSVSAWVRTMVVPVAGNGDTILTGWQNSWGQGVRTAKFGWSWTSDDGKVGMIADLAYDNLGNFGAADWAMGWWQPADWVKLSVGHIDATGGELRSDVCYGSWNWVRPYNWVQGDEGITFSAGGVDGLRVQLFPVEGLQIMAQLPLIVEDYWVYSKEDVKHNAYGVKNSDKEEDVNVYKKDALTYQKSYKAFGNGTVAVGYTIGDIGTIKAAFLGGYDGADKKYGTVNAAFDLTAIENMFLTVGARIPVQEKYGKSDRKALVSLGFSYQIVDNFRIALTAAANIKDSDDPAISAGVGIDYGFTDTLGLVADFRYNGDLQADKTTLSFLVGLDYNFASNGKLGIGFQGATEGNGVGFAGYKTDFSWTVPVKFELSF